jgi:uridylate kinase
VTDTHAPAHPEGLLSAPTAFAPPEAGGYSRVLLKLSGEAFGGGSVGVDAGIVRNIAEQLAEVVHAGTQVAVVVGGGQLLPWRGALPGRHGP